MRDRPELPCSCSWRRRAMKSSTSWARKRRWPPGVVSDGSRPRLAHRRTVTGATSSRSATSFGVRNSARRELFPAREGLDSDLALGDMLLLDSAEFVSRLMLPEASTSSLPPNAQLLLLLRSGQRLATAQRSDGAEHGRRQCRSGLPVIAGRFGLGAAVEQLHRPAA